MPPKKQNQQELLNLPPLNTIQANIVFIGKIKHEDLFKDKLKQLKTDFHLSITKEMLENLAKEYQFYLNPNEMNDKQKKDPKFQEIATELTQEVLFKTLNRFIELETEERKKIKKAKEEGKDYKPAPTKDAKAKKDAKAQIMEEETKKFELNSNKSKDLDLLFLFNEFPLEYEELISFYKANSFEIVIFVEEEYEPPKFVDNFKVILDNQKKKFDDLRESANVFEFKKTEVNSANNIHFEYTLEDLEGIQSKNELKRRIEKFKSESQLNDCIRNTTFITKKIIIDKEINEEQMENIIRQIFSIIFEFSFDITNYQEWIKKSTEFKVFSFGKEDFLMEAVQESQIIGTEERKTFDLDKSRDEGNNLRKSSYMKTNTSIDTSFDIRGSSIRGTQSKLLFYYNRQLSTLEDYQIGPEILLEALLDQLVYDRENSSGVSTWRKNEIEEENEIKNIILKGKEDMKIKFESLKPSFGILKATDPNFPEQLINIISEDDQQSKNLKNSQLFSLEICSKKAKVAFEKYIQVPGINRFQMPLEEEVDIKRIRANLSFLYSFCKNISVTEFKRRQNVTKFENFLKELLPRVQWDLSNREYVENLTHEDFKWRYFSMLKDDPSVFSYYNKDEDNLFLIMYYNTPAGREFRKQWNYPFKIIPSLEQWVKFFKENSGNMNNLVYYDIDSFSSGNISSRTKYMYPKDNAIIECNTFTIGESIFYRNTIIKEGMTFGFKQITKGCNYPDFWINYENQTKLLAEFEKNGTEYKLHPSLSLKSGLIVKFLSNNEVLQSMISGSHKEQKRIFDDIASNREEKFNLSEQEICRVITEQGSVFRHMKDGSMQVLFSNGNIAINRRSGNWVRINNKGMKVLHNAEGNHTILQDQLRIKKKTDFETGSKVLIREDNVTVTYYRDGSILTKHRDGTTIFKNGNRQELIIQKEGYASVKYKFDEVKARMKTVIGSGSSFASIGFQDIMERSYNGRVCELTLPENTKVFHYLEKKELEGYNNFIEQYISLIFNSDGSCVKTQENGEVAIISALDRKNFDENYNDKEYFLQLFLNKEDRHQGTYSCEVNNDVISTKDLEGNYFEVKSGGNSFSDIAISFNVNSSGKRPSSPTFKGSQYIREDSKFLPQPEIQPPKLFLVEKEGVQEFLQENQLEYYFMRQKRNPNFNMQSLETKIGNIEVKNISLYTKIKDYKSINFINSTIPKCITPLPQLKTEKDSPNAEFISVRRLKQYKQLTKDDRKEIEEVLRNYDEFKRNLKNTRDNYFVISKDAEELEKEFIIQMEIYERRKKDLPTSDIWTEI